MARDSKNKPAAWELLKYLVGKKGMQQWVSLGLALPTRTDVHAVKGRTAFTKYPDSVHGWGNQVGFRHLWNDVANNELTSVIAGKESVDSMLAKIAAARKARLTIDETCSPRAAWRAGSDLRKEERGGRSRLNNGRVTEGLATERVREALVGLAFIALPMAFFLLFFIFPVGYAFYISRYNWQIFKGPFVGWDNYRTLYHDSTFWNYAVSQHADLHRIRRAAADDDRAHTRGRGQPDDPVSDVLPRGFLFPVARRFGCDCVDRHVHPCLRRALQHDPAPPGL